MKYLLSISCFLIMLAQPQSLLARQTGRVFEISQPDYKQSPLTGMTRQHWKQAGIYMLQGAFSYVHQLDDYLVFPHQPGKSYPVNEKQLPVEKLEGLCRTLFIAAPLLKEDSNLVINGIRLLDYYRHHFHKLLDPAAPGYIAPRAPQGGPHQVLVEFGALSISFFAAPEILWNTLDKPTRDGLAALMMSYGDGPTNPSNWRFFNIFVLSFLSEKGYAVNNKLLEQYLQLSLTHYRGGGWYSDVPAYDYYSMWAFQMYGLLWVEFFGRKNYPAESDALISHFRDMTKTYPYMFGRNGHMIMWGRSISYRYAANTPLALTGYLEDADINYGWMRRLASGTLLQFLQHPSFLSDHIPTLGFYGAFESAIQSYSCRGSVFWMGKSFLALLLPASNPFWAEKENDGPWLNEIKTAKTSQHFQQGPGILITDYAAAGVSEIRAWCNTKINGNWTDYRANENYNRLAYNSAFPWQTDGPAGEVAMNYRIGTGSAQSWEPLHLYTFQRYENNVYYRKAVLETDSTAQMNLADLFLPNGILRVDRLEASQAQQVRLGHYALPAIQGAIKKKTQRVDGHTAVIIDNGKYQLAMITLRGWDKQEVVTATGLHPEAAQSAVINAITSVEKGQDPKWLLTLQLWKPSGVQWKPGELMPVKQVKPSADGNAITVFFKDGRTQEVIFKN